MSLVTCIIIFIPGLIEPRCKGGKFEKKSGTPAEVAEREVLAAKKREIRMVNGMFEKGAKHCAEEKHVEILTIIKIGDTVHYSGSPGLKPVFTGGQLSVNCGDNVTVVESKHEKVLTKLFKLNRLRSKVEPRPTKAPLSLRSMPGNRKRQRGEQGAALSSFVPQPSGENLVVLGGVDIDTTQIKQRVFTRAKTKRAKNNKK